MKISTAHIATMSLAALLAIPACATQSAPESAPQPAPQLQDQDAASPAVSTATPSVSAASPAVSRVRIVRLSQARGTVQVDRAVGRGFEPAMANLPIVENCRLQTGKGVAEVEFEDNSTLRLAPDSEVEFPALQRLANGSTLSSVRVVKGMVYVNLMKTSGNAFNLLFDAQSLPLPPSAHVRLQLQATGSQLAVLGGAVPIQSPEGLVDVPHKRTITFPFAASSLPTVAKSVASSPFDPWDHSAVDYHARLATVSALRNTPYSYGLSDMMYYGDFASFGGCGMMWRPYFASAAWDPYSNGAWAWYGGMGYSWVSPYPWGWMPYHYGMWSYCQGAGWGWMPGGAWMGVNNIARFAGMTGSGNIPRVPIHPPRIGQPTLRPVNLRPLVQSQVGSSNSFVFRRDSAGLGVPRAELGKLNRFSQHADARGMASTPIYVQAPVEVRLGGRPALAGVTSMHRGFPPPAEMGGAGMGGQGRMPPGFAGRLPGTGSQTSGPSMSRPSMPSGPPAGGGGGAPAPAGPRR